MNSPVHESSVEKRVRELNYPLSWHFNEVLTVYQTKGYSQTGQNPGPRDALEQLKAKIAVIFEEQPNINYSRVLANLNQDEIGLILSAVQGYAHMMTQESLRTDSIGRQSIMKQVSINELMLDDLQRRVPSGNG